MADTWGFTPVDHDPFAEMLDYAKTLPETKSVLTEEMPEFSDEITKQNWIKEHSTQVPVDKSYSGAILPFSQDAEGKSHFDINAGLPGAAIRAATLPGDVATGKVDPNSQEALERSTDLAGLLTAPALTTHLPDPDTLGIFAGARSKTLNKENLLRAQGLEDQGLGPRTIWHNTGFDKGPDTRWRYEINDQNAKLHDYVQNALDDTNMHGVTISAPASRFFHHPELFQAYPELRDYPVKLTHNPNKPYSGSFNPNTKEIEINSNKSVTDTETNLEKYNSPLDIFLHEAQHAVQRIEGFEPGSNVQYYLPKNFDYLPEDQKRQIYKDAWDRYYNNSGEAEARNATFRRDLSRADRQRWMPHVTEDVDRADQLSPWSDKYGFTQVDHDPFKK